jgi:hypothetical protein
MTRHCELHSGEATLKMAGDYFGRGALGATPSQ